MARNIDPSQQCLWFVQQAQQDPGSTAVLMKSGMISRPATALAVQRCVRPQHLESITDTTLHCHQQPQPLSRSGCMTWRHARCQHNLTSPCNDLPTNLQLLPLLIQSQPTSIATEPHTRGRSWTTADRFLGSLAATFLGYSSRFPWQPSKVGSPIQPSVHSPIPGKLVSQCFQLISLCLPASKDPL